MNKKLLILACLLVVISSISQEMQHDHTCNKRHELHNTRWLSIIENCCVNYYEFKEHGSYIYYSGEREEYSPGVYSIKEDTLFLHEFYFDEDDPFALLDREVKFIALIKENSFQLLYREDLIRTMRGEVKWLKTMLEKQTYWKFNSKTSP